MLSICGHQAQISLRLMAALARLMNYLLCLSRVPIFLKHICCARPMRGILKQVNLCMTSCLLVLQQTILSFAFDYK